MPTLHDPARGTRRGDCRSPQRFETPRNQVQQRLDTQALVEKLDHVFEVVSGLFASDGQLSDCRNQRRLFHFAAPKFFRESHRPLGPSVIWITNDCDQRQRLSRAHRLQ